MAARPSSKAGLARLLKTLEESGDIALVDDALVAMAKGLAAAVDSEPSNAALWREYRQVWLAVKEAASGGIDDDTASFLVTVRTPGRGSPQVVDSEDA